MNQANNDWKVHLLRDAASALEQFRLFERLYRKIKGPRKDLLRTQSRAYRETVQAIQELIGPAVRETCPTCRPHCCHLSQPDLKIYIARVIGGFTLSDFLLARCDREFPAPDERNIKKNLCLFWEAGCRLPADGRSILCLEYFCDRLKAKIDMPQVERLLRQLRNITADLSLPACLGFPSIPD